MKRTFLFLTFLFIYYFGNAQNSLAELLKTFNKENIPYITVSELTKIQDQVLLFDAREPQEFEISHIKNATLVGYNSFNISNVLKNNIDKDQPIVVYCSLGVRSEDISEKLKEAGFSKVYNLYGGIFEWKNNDHPVVNSEGELTENVHPCSKEWEKWLVKGQKVYSN